MKSLKKSVIAGLVIGTLSVAGTAFACHGQGFNGQNFARRGCPPFESREAWQASRGGDFAHHAQFFNETPQEIRDKEVEIQKLRIDLRNVLSGNPLDRGKAAELSGQIDKLRQDVRTWRFEQKLNRIEEVNRKAVEDAGAAQDK
ncbi:MAG: hypothetical protein K5841_06295 [Fretibacterium sp.]|nr:hypothetical protein [Fretibacterium sp.]